VSKPIRSKNESVQQTAELRNKEKQKRKHTVDDWDALPLLFLLLLLLLLLMLLAAVDLLLLLLLTAVTVVAVVVLLLLLLLLLARSVILFSCFSWSRTDRKKKGFLCQDLFSHERHALRLQPLDRWYLFKRQAVLGHLLLLLLVPAFAIIIAIVIGNCCCCCCLLLLGVAVVGGRCCRADGGCAQVGGSGLNVGAVGGQQDRCSQAILRRRV